MEASLAVRKKRSRKIMRATKKRTVGKKVKRKQ